MIKTENVFYKYENTIEGDALTDISVEIPKGQVVLLCGESGSGKTTYTRVVNGLLSSYYEGKLSGDIEVCGKDVMHTPLHELAKDIGSVFQNPKSQFYTLITDTEIVFGCENLGIAKDEVLRRFDRVVGDFNIEDLLGRNLFSLSGGEKQKIACACVATLNPKIIIMDEPSSNLDIKSIAELGRIIRKWKQKGCTIIVAEHRLSWLKDIVDRVIYFKDGRIAEDSGSDLFWKHSTDELHEMGLRAPAEFKPLYTNELSNEIAIDIKRLSLKKKKKTILDVKDLRILKGAVVAILGNCGAGKSTFARCFCGLEKKALEEVYINGRLCKRKVRLKKSYMVMQDVNHQLFTSSVEEEILLGVKSEDEHKREEILNSLIKQMDIEDYKEAHPMSLSGGQKQRVAIASALASDKDIMFFDEPTSGLDYKHMKEVSECIKQLSTLGKTQFVITHDPELVAGCCDYFIFIEDGLLKKHGEWNQENIDFVAGFFSRQ